MNRSNAEAPSKAQQNCVGTASINPGFGRLATEGGSAARIPPAGGAPGGRIGVSFTVAFIGESTGGATRTVSFPGPTCGPRLTGTVPSDGETAFGGDAGDFRMGVGGASGGFSPAEGADGFAGRIAGGGLMGADGRAIGGAGGRFAAVSSVRGEGVIWTVSLFGSFRSAISTNSSYSARTNGSKVSLKPTPRCQSSIQSGQQIVAARAADFSPDEFANRRGFGQDEREHRHPEHPLRFAQ